MTHLSSAIPYRLLAALLVGGGLVLGGCDAVPSPESTTLQPPTVSDLRVLPDTVEVSQEDSVAQVTLGIFARASDPDGSIARVVFLLEPSSSPRGTGQGTLPSFDASLYGGGLSFTVPLAPEVYTVRVFAIDSDSLASNQVTGQFRFNPEAYMDTTSLRSVSSPSGGASSIRVDPRPSLFTTPGHQRP